MLEKIYWIVSIIVVLLWASSVFLGIGESDKSDKYYQLFKITSWTMLVLFGGGLICKIIF